jgi:hypothetical protein
MGGEGRKGGREEEGERGEDKAVDVMRGACPTRRGDEPRELVDGSALELAELVEDGLDLGAGRSRREVLGVSGRLDRRALQVNAQPQTRPASQNQGTPNPHHPQRLVVAPAAPADLVDAQRLKEPVYREEEVAEVDGLGGGEGGVCCIRGWCEWRACRVCRQMGLVMLAAFGAQPLNLKSTRTGTTRQQASRRSWSAAPL